MLHGLEEKLVARDRGLDQRVQDVAPPAAGRVGEADVFHGRLRHVAPPSYAGSSTTGRRVTPRKTMLGGIGSGTSSTRRKRRVRAGRTRSATSASRVASDAPRQ